MAAIGVAVSSLLFLYLIILIARMVVSTIASFSRDWVPAGFGLMVIEFLYLVTDPPVLLARRVIPPIRLGAVAFDLSATLVILVVILLMNLSRLLLP
ncbi:MAG: YggT family protein [Actinomycetes bacterium]